jgi:subtilisin family serine protease
VGWISRQSRDVAALIGAIAAIALLAAVPASASKTPNDPGFPKDWAFQNTGQPIQEQPASIPFADDSGAEAWGVTTGSSSIVIAETDTGVYYEHADLAQNIWSNPGIGVGGCAAGTHGFDMLVAENLPHSCEPTDEDPTANGHGTPVAGILGAVGNNGVGVVGINWQTSILPVTWLESAGKEIGQEPLAKALELLVRVKEANVNLRVVNASAVFRGVTKSEPKLEHAIQKLGEHNVLFVTAAGNWGENDDASPHYPCSYHLPNEICVTATNDRDELPSWASYGPQTVDLAAPGAGIYSTLRNGQYGFVSGSSMAAAEVSGAAALILSTDQSLSVSELKDDILFHVDKLKSLEGRVATGGRLDVCNAIPGCTDLNILPPSPPKTPPTPLLTGLKLAPYSFKAARKGASISARRARVGATVTYSDTQPALSEFRVLTPRAGVLNAAKLCVSPPRRASAHAHRAKACARYVRVGRFWRVDVAGQNRFHFSGRVGRGQLAPGRYRLEAVPVLAGVSGPAASANFRIIS